MPKKKPAAAQTLPRFIGLNSAGQQLPPGDASTHAIYDTRTQLLWARQSLKASSWSHAQEVAAGVQLLGQACRLPECDELLSLVDRKLFSPAADHAHFKFLDLSDWYWSRTPCAWSPSDYAWYVSLSLGNANYDHQDLRGLALAVRGPVALPSQ